MVAIFDVVGTHAVQPVVRAVFRDASVPDDFLPFWFARLLHVSMASALAQRYVTFRDAAEASLRQALAFRGLPLDVVPATVNAMRSLEPWEDVRPCLAALRQSGHTLVALSNSSPETIRALLAKPDPNPYWRALERGGVPASSACMVAAHAWDIQGAVAVGLPTIRISRLEKAWSFPNGTPGRTVASLDEVPGKVAEIERAQAISHRS